MIRTLFTFCLTLIVAVGSIGGTVCKAAALVHADAGNGRGRNYARKECVQTRKNIWLSPLRKDC